MILKAVTLVSLAACVLGDGHHHAISEQKIVRHYHHGELSHIGHKEPEHHEEYAHAYPSYEFSYMVNDPHTHDHKGHSETRKGDEVKGEYWLIEPDGRKRTVKYHADKHSGFKAHVEYSAPHHHVDFKTHKHEEHKHEEHKHEEHKHEEHKHEEHKHEEHKHEEHKHKEHKLEEHKHKEHKHEEHKHKEHKHEEHKHMEHKHEDHHEKHIYVHHPLLEARHEEVKKPVHEDVKEHPKYIPALSLHAPRYHKFEEERFHPRDYRRYRY